MVEISLQQPQLDNNLYLLEKRYEVLLDINNKKLLKEINGLREHIKKLEDDIQNLSSSQNLQASTHSCAGRVVQKTLEVREEPKPTIIEAKQSNAQNTKQEISSEDVSIEKYFYFGKK